MNEWMLGGIIIVVTILLIGGGNMLMKGMRGPNYKDPPPRQ